jgi:hypothetical protein
VGVTGAYLARIAHSKPDNLGEWDEKKIDLRRITLG